MNAVEYIQKIVKNVISDTVNIKYLTCTVESISPLKFVTDNKHTILGKQVIFTESVLPTKLELEVTVPQYIQEGEEQDYIAFVGCKGHEATGYGTGTSNSFTLKTKKDKVTLELNKPLEVGEKIVLQKLNHDYLFLGRAVTDPFKEKIINKGVEL